MSATVQTIATSDAAAGSWRQEAEHHASDLPGRLASIEREYGDPARRASAMLDAVMDCLGCLASCLDADLGGQETDAHRKREVEGVEAWTATLRATAREARGERRTIARLFGAEPGRPEYAVVAAPIESGPTPLGAVSALVRCGNEVQAERLQLHLQAACAQAARMLSRAAPKSTIEMNDIARVFTRAGQFRDLYEFAYTITNSARQRFHCDQAAMGVVRGGKVDVLCISGLDQVKRRSPGVRVLEQAMGECFDCGRPVVAQQRDRWEETAFAEDGLLHQRWRASAAGSCVLSVPILAGDEVVSIVSFRRPADQPFDAEDLAAAQKLLAPLSGAIPLVGRATRRLHVHLAHSARETKRWWLTRGSIRKKLAVGGLVILFTWILFSSRMYRVSAPAVVVAERQHVVACPIDGAVAEVMVRAGQQVTAGDALARMDTSALELERRQLEAELRRAELKVSEGVALRDPSAASIAQSELRTLQTRLQHVLWKIDASQIRAATSGIVIGSELTDLPGRLMAVGEPILAIADPSSLALELHVPEGRVADLVSGAKLRFASHARPESPGYTTLDRVAPASVERSGRAVFVAEATLPTTQQDWLRPGMEGVAMVEVGERSNWWLMAHRVTNAARLRFWMD